MAKSAEFLAALRAAQCLSGSTLDAGQVETMGARLGLEPGDLPDLIAALQHQKAVALHWGGRIEVLPEQRGQVIHAVNSIVQAPVGGSAVMGNISLTAGEVGASSMIGELAAAIEALRTARGVMPEQAAERAQEAEAAIERAAAPETPVSERPTLLGRAMQHLKGALALAPQIKALADVSAIVGKWLA